MSVSRRRLLSAAYRPSPPSTLQRPARPFISLDDPYTQNYFNRRHIRNHLKRSGLLTKQGEIVTQAEYDDRRTDVTIGRENQRKIDDVLTEVLNDMAKEHWGYAREYIDKLRNDLIHEFQRIEEQYRRRKQFISIRHVRDGSTRSIQPDDTTSTPSPIQPNFPHLSPEREPLDPNQLRHELEDIKVKLNNLNNRLGMTPTPIQNSGIDVSRLEDSIGNLEKNSNDIREQMNILDQRFEERIIILEAASRPLSIKSFQAKIDKAIRTSEEKAVQREHIIENIARNLDGKINRVDTQIGEILTLLAQLPQLNIDGNVIQSIQNVIRNVEKVQEDDNKWITLAREAVDKMNQLENRLNRTNNDDNRIEALQNEIRDNSRDFQLLQRRLVQLEERNFQTVTNNVRDKEKSNQKLQELEHSIRENGAILSNMQRSIRELDSRLNQHLITTSGGEYQPSSNIDSIPAPVISTKSQTTMPFIERLPALDMLVENE